MWSVAMTPRAAPAHQADLVGLSSFLLESRVITRVQLPGPYLETGLLSLYPVSPGRKYLSVSNWAPTAEPFLKVCSDLFPNGGVMLIPEALLCRGSGPVANAPKCPGQHILPLTARMVGGGPLIPHRYPDGPRPPLGL